VLKIAENLWAVGALRRTRLGELTALPETPSWWGGVAAASLRTPPPLSALRSCPNETWARPFAVGLVENIHTRISAAEWLPRYTELSVDKLCVYMLLL